MANPLEFNTDRTYPARCISTKPRQLNGQRRWAFGATFVKIRNLGYGVRSDFELNFGRYLPAFGQADNDGTNTQPG